MKKIILICAAASFFAACNGKSDTDLETKKDVVVTDTSSMYRSNGSTDTGRATVVSPVPPPVVETKIITQTRTVYVDRKPKSAPRVNAPNAVAKSNTVTPLPQSSTNSTTTTKSNSSGTGASNTTGTTATPAAPVAKERGWSNAAKDAVIGGGVGAVGGAIISKKKGKGALIGGVIGAAGGYILGRKKDKADTTR